MPSSAVVTTTERIFVIAVRGGQATWVDVKRGSTTGSQVEVFGELRPDDRVVQRGTDELRAGTHVETKAK
ncbi:MAG: hypothetical protein HY303_13055 [Candidatus Wallbacteria bacterium]|nr:hypothetical protein [Candidatus Wallbacteria bacterium]